MIPIRLDIQGLYSYQEKQTIEFDQLTAAGLFGIFGAVGSGKSSILEAILLALYGSTERLSDRGEKNSMVNLQSAQVLINFEFKAGKNNVHTYLARYCAKRNPKNFDEVKPAEHTFYQRSGDTWTPVNQKADELIGMKKEHFKQTVIIPQGKFREFIDLTPGPRAEMMKELFGLERFDLSGKTGSLLKQVREEKIRLETQLQGLEEISSENLESKKEIFGKLVKELGLAQQNFNKVEQELKAEESIREKSRQLGVFKKDWNALEEKRPQIEANRLLHKQFITAKTNIKPVWDQLKDTRADLEKYTVSLIDCERFKIEYEKEIKMLEDEELKLKEKNSERPAREEKIRDLKKVIEIKKLQIDLDAAKAKLDKIKPLIEENKTHQKDLELQIKQAEEKAEQIQITDTNLLTDLKVAAKDWSQLESKVSQLEGQNSAMLSEKAQLEKSLNLVLNKIPNGLKNFDLWFEEQKHIIKETETQRENLLQKQGLSAHIHLLHSGEPCPLCGALEHPSPLQSEDDDHDLIKITTQLSAARELQEKIRDFAQEETTISLQIKNLNSQIEGITAEIAENKISISALIEKLKSQNIQSQKELLTKIEQAQNVVQEKEKLNHEAKRLRKIWEAGREKLEQEEIELQDATLRHQSLNAGINSKKEEIKDPTFCKPFFEKSRDVIEEAIQKVEKNITETQEALEGKQKYLNEKRSDQVGNLTNLKNFKTQQTAAKEKSVRLESELDSLKFKYGFPDNQVLVELFEHSIDAEKVDLEIRDFDKKWATLESRIKELEAEKGVLEFQESSFQELATQFQLLKTSFQSTQDQHLLLQREIQENEKKLAEKTELEKTFKALQNREANLRELDNLFRGSGFVKYVSTIYLKELCNTANVRFMKLCKNSLSLEIDDDNTFWVIDYLNGGKRRLLKTLSGGQTFQASLCLALALAEKVKSLNQADQSFFFLDEGFGALDRNALRVVFETLKSLRQENRIVGIISHVEELQQEIGVFAQIELDPEHGSQVSYSY